jgi:hypothetical protein
LCDAVRGPTHVFVRQDRFQDASRIREAEQKRVARVWHVIIENKRHEAGFCFALLPPGVLRIGASRKNPEELPVLCAKNAGLNQASRSASSLRRLFLFRPGMISAQPGGDLADVQQRPQTRVDRL